MKCKNHNFNKISGNEVIDIENKYLKEVAVNGEKWRTLYQCKNCCSFFEERYTGGRWDGIPQLVSVTKEYVIKNWGKEYI